ncbi:multi antimicrobial extrusion protein MatE [Sediminibacillus dalangtanensis]|uniref:Multi antimicrobial extrusion protein MatE n=1 Tax=Sediminibacillus dalangtanensis TaxID=2729421 RepID=A0ABX7VQE3_9BACI|nr:multi antimicrobial extrusion protein MatE [Sediminibacillus dalangtanensis]QTM99152.1 multi antimicrobial extrusion protein MatE [Sediminibacillus dalangtanensis]
MKKQSDRFGYKQLAGFFIPLGFSASLTSITHVIINGTLSRGEHAAFIIACYAVAFSLFGIIERPVIVFRQTCSALVNDRLAFRKLWLFMVYILAVIIGLSMAMAFSSMGDWVYVKLFNADENMVHTISEAFTVIAVVIIFSGIRGIYQGIIINHLQTKWLTIGVVIRLVAMFVIAYLFVAFDYVKSVTGSVIFLTGMIMECGISVWKGKRILTTHYPKQVEPLSMKEISQFYMPLVFYFLIQTILIPIIYVFLAQTENMELGIASFALAYSITQMLMSFFMYTHQLVLQLYETNKQKVVRFMGAVSLLPTLLLLLLCYTPAGYWFMETIMGANGELAESTLAVMKFFIIKTLVFPWVDFLNGFLMLHRQTRKMLIAQLLNLVTVVLSIWLFVRLFPAWNGISGSLAASVGEFVGLIMVSIIIYQMTRKTKRQKQDWKAG